MLTGSDILDREIVRLQHLVEERRFSFLGKTVQFESNADCDRNHGDGVPAAEHA